MKPAKEVTVTNFKIPKELRFKFVVFGGFYLTVIRENPYIEKGRR
jgi:hypothetical protein